MRERFIVKDFKPATLAVIAAANEICVDYAAQGYDLTLRQVYYQFVARDLLANTARNYKRLGSIISDARLAGLLDWRYIVDRTRGIVGPIHSVSPQDDLESLADAYLVDKWAQQSHRIEIWVEKEALAGIVSRTTDGLDLDYFSCRGYVSQSAMYRAGRRLAGYEANGQQPIVLHLGDHDPSGIDMTRDIRERLLMFAGGSGLNHGIEVIRIALTMEQIEELNPPPNPTKLTDARAQSYIAEYGTDSWELDALEPSYLDQLIKENVSHYLDEDLYQEAIEEENDAKEKLRQVAEEWDLS